MSYILEALKKSQQERELGHVPTLETAGIFAPDKEEVSRRPWALVAVALAGVAVVIALYAAIRTPVQPEIPSVQVPAATPAPPKVAAAQPAGPRVAETAAPSPATPPPLQDLDDLSVTRSPSPAPKKEPSAGPLVEPPPPKGAASAPHRASARVPVGDERFPAQGGPSHGDDDLYDLEAERDMDPELELELQRQLEEESYPVEELEPEYGLPPQGGPIPNDLVEDINAFKRRLGGKETKVPDEPAAPEEPAPKARKFEGDPTRLRLTRQQQAELPAYFMTVHVYDQDSAKRFILINGLRYREGDKTREGLTVEQIVPQGAVLGFRGNPFFVHR
jgi:general secretion pathway protein B